MNNCPRLLKNVLQFFALVAFFFLSIQPVFALSSSEIEKQIETQKNALAATNENIQKIQQKISSLQSGYSSKQSQLESTNTEINSIASEIDTSIKQAEELGVQIETKSKEIVEIQDKIRDGIKAIQIHLKNNDNNILTNTLQDNISAGQFLKITLSQMEDRLRKVVQERISIVDQKSQVDIQVQEFTKQKETLSQILEEIKINLNNIASEINNTNKSKSALTQKVLSIQSTIDQLGEEQKKALQREREILEQAAKEAAKPVTLVKGEFYISGRGRDLYDGHAIGMSKWGAYGAGKNGMDYKTILKKYYTGVEIGSGYESKSIVVSGYGSMNIETYLSGLGEVPDIACETAENSGKPYVKKDDPSTLWDCWPEEAIKAQIVAARSYALGSIARNPSMSVATDASFQVYKGGSAKKWASEATKGEVVTYSGSIATTYYTASLRGHSENNELYWTSRGFSKNSLNELKGSAVAYLRGIDDSAWAFKNEYYDWKWKTNSFSMQKLTEILKPTTSDIGKIKEIQTIAGSSARIWAMTIVGEKSTVYMAGWKFKAIINDYLYDSTQDRNYVYSTEFDIIEVK